MIYRFGFKDSTRKRHPGGKEDCFSRGPVDDPRSRVRKQTLHGWQEEADDAANKGI